MKGRWQSSWMMDWCILVGQGHYSSRDLILASLVEPQLTSISASHLVHQIHLSQCVMHSQKFLGVRLLEWESLVCQFSWSECEGFMYGLGGGMWARYGVCHQRSICSVWLLWTSQQSA